jgi:uncharacterized protein
MSSDGTAIESKKNMMQTNVAQLLKSPIGSLRTLTVDDKLEDNGTKYTVKGDVTLTLTNRSILAQGKLTSQTKIACSRCLKPFTCKITLNLQEEYFPTIDIITGARLPEPEDPGSFTLDEHHELDLTEAIRQYIVTAMPMKPLCKATCAGLCATCGKDLNLGKCDCTTEAIDPRWAELLKLKNSNKVKISNRNKGRK